MKKNYSFGRNRRKIKIRAKIKSGNIPIRLSVFRSNRFIYAQLIDDKKKKTLLTISEKVLNLSEEKKTTKNERAKMLGQKIAEKSQKLDISKVVFDRNGYKYHGRVKAFAEEARRGGLKF